MTTDFIQLQEQSFMADALYCDEEKFAEIEDEAEECLDEETEPQNDITKYHNKLKSSLFSLLLLEQDFFWENEELISLFSKEKESHFRSDEIETNSSLSEARRGAVEWILRVNSHYGFSSLTAVLAVNYLDRFVSSLQYQHNKQWMIQLAAVSCISLAAKVEETEVPLLLDLQVEDANYVFEAKTIQRMELLVLSTLKWRMNPVTPHSFLDHIIRRLGLRNHLHWDFLRKCENLLLSIVADCRYVRYPPSVLASATMLHVIHQLEPRNAVDYQTQLLDVLKISKEKVSSCYEELILEHSKATSNAQKRKYDPDSNNINSSKVSWESSELSSLCSSPENPFKKSRVNHEQKIKLH